MYRQILQANNSAQHPGIPCGNAGFLTSSVWVPVGVWVGGPMVCGGVSLTPNITLAEPHFLYLDSVN